MTFSQAARQQYLRHTIYTVVLVGPNGEREQVATTQRKSGTGLVSILRRESVQARIAQLPGAATATFTKKATSLFFSNGWRLEFGGTIRQEAD
jgi:hypothetical protein